MIAQLIKQQTDRIDQTLSETYFQLGYQDGISRRGMSGKLSSNPDYCRGWGEGYRAWKAQQPPVAIASLAWSEGSVTTEFA